MSDAEAAAVPVSTGHSARATPAADVPDKTSMADLIRQRGALPESDLVRFFVEVLKDLEFAHGQAMLHRDITSVRIVREGGAFKLVDYGLSRVGTVRYMSPERCQGKPVDSRSDIYSLGIALYEAATGRLPFDGDMNFQIIDAQVNKPPPPPRSINRGISADIERVILRALTKNPAGRFQTAGDFRQVLESLSGKPQVAAAAATAAGAKPLTAAASAAGRPRRSPVGLLVVLGVGLAIGAGFVAVKLGIIPAGRKAAAFIGMSEVDARALIGSAGLIASFEVVDDTLPAGLVVRQAPVAGARFGQRETLRMSVSSGQVRVPELAGSSLAQAREALTKAALVLAKVDSQYSDSPGIGTVMASGPKGGSRVKPRAEVTLTVSSGRATCPDCRARRAPGANFCEKCGYKF